ncbi:MAG: hypothetical protein J6Q44_00705 [Alphaproteobacteria bacterium]|nr:hypothetical protein [Alphaproteobacteria bacterium]
MVDSYSKQISDIIYDTENYEVELLFYLTQYCNLRCNGCYMRSSPNVSQNVLPHEDLNFYLGEFEKIPNFTNSVVFSGGEIFTAPINYVAACANMVLDRGLGLQLKTNGAWVADANQQNTVINMLRNLRPRRGLMADEQQIQDFLRRYPKWLLRICGRWLLMKKLPTTSSLSMAVSVDDKLHPAGSADWFVNIADLITNDKNLRNRVNLKTFTIAESVPLLESRILNNPQLNVQNFEKMPQKWAAKYTINGVRVESFVGDFVDVGAVSAVKKLSEIVMPPVGNARGRLVYCFYPDGTVGFDCNYLESVGRVSYRGADGKCKSLNQIKSDMHNKLVADYMCAIQK